MIIGYRSHGVRPAFAMGLYFIYRKGSRNGNTYQSVEHTTDQTENRCGENERRERGGVQELVAPYQEQFKKKRIEEDDPLWAMNTEDEGSDTVQALLKKIDERLKKLRKLSDEVN